ncbi:MAG: hypothetical protein HY744_26570 [Deltaproteobacteria bacterium]|nr:hypothetical protein [Deltaproteobacteria bacterium]
MRRAQLLGVLFGFGLVVVAGCGTESQTNIPLGHAPGTGGGSVSSTSSGSGGWESSSGTSCPDCDKKSTGAGTDQPFDPQNKESANVGLDDDGALVLDQSMSGIPGIIWISNTGQNTVSKVDTTTFQELGRYRVGTSDPSRTSVNTEGDVYVGCRGGQSLMKISSAGKDCPDTNNDGKITTSSGPNDILPFGQDDCVLWHVPVPNPPLVRGVAAQDVPADPNDPEITGMKNYVWTGGTNHKTVYKYDGKDGKLLIQTASPACTYGLALDGKGMLWQSGNVCGAEIGRIDTNQCHDQASCDSFPVCESSCNEGGCTANCDAAVKERIKLPQSVYGITVDFKQRVWVGGSGIKRYDPAAPPAQRYKAINDVPFVHGIAADGKGHVWGAAVGSGVVRVDGDTMQKVIVPVPNAKGMAVDKDGKIWGVSWGNEAHVIVPGYPALNDFNMIPNAVTGLVSCYTYSDMTGQQLSLATNKPGYYREIFDRCQDGEPKWMELFWDVVLEDKTKVRFRVRTAPTVDALKDAKWIAVAEIPSDKSPADLVKAFADAGITQQHLLEVEVRLEGWMDADKYTTPHVKSFGISYLCGPAVH